ncbi:MAG: molecular chaperone DnaK [Acidimicrobiaceae bacterium]|jgi:actin-like ATPase involved in cell morphogenesis
MGYVLGIDLGTTYTAVATYRDGRAQIVSIGTRTAAIPSVVFLRQDQAVLTGEAADRRALSEPARVAREFKRRVGDTTPIMVGGSPYSAEQLSAELLKAVVERVTQLEGQRPDHVAVCHPANWGPYKKELLDQTVALADIGTPTFVTEPEAAAIHYASTEHVDPGEIVAVYDLGGGTFDTAVLRKTETGFETLGEPQGVERLGGIDFDAAVFAHVRNAVGGALDDLDENDPTVIAAAARLREECIEAKEALSSDTETSIPVLLPNVMTEVRLTRGEFESMIRPTLNNTIVALQRALRSANVQPSDISRVLLVGGSSRIPLVAELVGAELGRPVAIDAHPKHAIALGAAIAAAAAVVGTTTAEMAAAASVVATPEEPVVSRTVTTSIAAPPAALEAGWQTDPTGRHEYRYWDGSAWTDDVSDSGVGSTDPMQPAATAPPAAARPARSGTAKSRMPVIAAVVVVALLLGGFLVTRGGGGGGGASGVGTIKGHVNENGVFVHHVEVPKDSVLLVKVIPEGNWDPVLSVAADFPTIEKFKNNFGFTEFGRGAIKTESESSFSGVDLTGVNGGIFLSKDDNRSPGVAEQSAIPASFAVSLDIVVNAVQGGSGDVTLQLVVKKFIGPPAGEDRGAFYDALVRQAYDQFLTGAGDINDTRDFTKQSDFTDNSDFSRFSSSFSNLDGLPK